MANSEAKFYKRRLRSSYLSVVVSITLVLFMLGIFSTMLLQAEDMARQIRENFTFTVLLNNNASEGDVRQFQKELELSEKVVGTDYITKDQAADELEAELGEEFVEYLGYNPLSDVIEVHMNADFVSSGNVENFETELRESGLVSDVSYDPNLLSLVNENIKKIGTYLLGGALLLIFISIAMINSSIRLSIYSKRFTIKTMQLVGATKPFIQRPFMWQSVKLGLIGGLIASVLLYGIMEFGKSDFLTWGLQSSLEMMAITFGGMILFGIFLAWSCTFFAVKRYLNLKTDDLYT